MEAQLYSLALTLQPEQPAVLPAASGHQAHAAFLDAIRRVDSELATLLHLRDADRPFTVSPLLEVRFDRQGQALLSPDRPCIMRVTLLENLLYKELMRRFLEYPGRPALRLGPASFLVTQVQVTPGSSRWAGHTTWEALWTAAQPVERVSLKFLTPTAFSLGQRPWGKRFHVLPDAGLVFGSLLRTWNRYAPAGLEMPVPVLREYLQDEVLVVEFDELRTVMWRYPRHMQVGFTGRVTYALKGSDETFRRQLNALAEFAFYAGVGYKTTMGMGQTRRVERGG